MSTIITDFVPYVPEGFEGPATTVVDALRRARATLDAEGRWMKGSWFSNAHPEVNPEDPYCNSWSVCAEGAVGIVTQGVVGREGYDGSQRWSYRLDSNYLYDSAVDLLKRAGQLMTGVYLAEANAYNDGIFTTRTQVLAWFDIAIAIAEGRKLYKDRA